MLFIATTQSSSSKHYLLFFLPKKRKSYVQILALSVFKYSSTPIQMFLTSNLYSFWNNMTFSELTESQYNFTCHVEYWLCHSNGIAPIVGCKILKDYALGCFVSNHKTLQSKHIYLPIFSSTHSKVYIVQQKFGKNLNALKIVIIKIPQITHFFWV